MNMLVRNVKEHIPLGLVFLCCWLTYLTAYLCRVNFSIAMGALAEGLSIPVDRLGTIGAIFFFVYAVGQLVNGFLGDRIHPIKFLLLSLTGMAACNIAVALCTSFFSILLFWGMNGYFQAIVWSTIIRILANTVASNRRASASTAISTSIAAGYFVSWSVLGQLLKGHSHTLYFLVPAACALVMAAVWLVIARQFKGMPAQQEGYVKPRSIGETVRFIRQKGLYLLCLVSILQGLMKEGVAFWFPLLVNDKLALPAVSPALLMAVIPAANLIGMFLSKGMLLRTRLTPAAILLFSFVLMTCACTALIFAGGGLLPIALIAVVSIFAYAGNTLLMAYIPMQFAKENTVASLVGIFDCASYAGAAISAFLLGSEMQASGLSFAAKGWTLAGLLAAAVCLILLMKERHQKAERCL